MSEEVLEIFPLKIIPSQVLLLFTGCPRDSESCSAVFDYLSRERASITLLIEGPAGAERRNLTLVLGEEVMDDLEPQLAELCEMMGATDFAVKKPVAVIRVLGPHFDIRPGITGRLYATLFKSGITLLAHSIAATTSLLVVYESELEKAKRGLETIFLPPGKR